MAALLLMLTFQPLAYADLAEAAKGLLAKSYNDKTAAVKKLAATGDPRAAALLEALLSGDLYNQGGTEILVVAKNAAGGYQITDILTDQDLGVVAKGTLSKIRINNNMRGLIKGLLGSLTLLNADPALRLKAANAIFRSRPEDMAKPVADALAAETDPTVQTALERALAAVNLTHGDTPEIRAEALLVLQELHDPEVKGLLSKEAYKLASMDNQSAENIQLAQGIQAALARIDEKLAFLGIVENIFQGLSLGSVLLLAAIGLAITFGVMGIINMAHGEM
ncbi:MAG: hypothetical protein K9G33_01765, partial [Sneathiella sp.]|nr:hypothetical protein [Sneathiella sp.]